MRQVESGLGPLPAHITAYVFSTINASRCSAWNRIMAKPVREQMRGSSEVLWLLDWILGSCFLLTIFTWDPIELEVLRLTGRGARAQGNFPRDSALSLEPVSCPPSNNSHLFSSRAERQRPSHRSRAPLLFSSLGQRLVVLCCV